MDKEECEAAGIDPRHAGNPMAGWFAALAALVVIGIPIGAIIVASIK